MPLSPTPVDVEGLFAYARVAPGPRRAEGEEVCTVGARVAPVAASPRAPAASELGRRLAALGLLDGALLADVPAGDARVLLELAGRVALVETEVMPDQVRTDVVAAGLAALADPALRGARFEQIALEDDADEAGELTSSCERSIDDDGARISSLPDDAVIPADAAVLGLARLRAHEQLRSWEIFAIDRGPWLDLPAILGLLNAMLRQHASPLRFVVLKGHDTRAAVLVGPMDALERAVEEGLLMLEGPDDALLRSVGDEDEPEGVLHDA